MSKKRRRPSELSDATLASMDRYIASLDPPPADLEALRQDLIAHLLFWKEPFLQFGEKWPEPGEPGYEELKALQARMDEDLRRVLTLHNPDLQHAVAVMLPRAHIVALWMNLINTALEMVGIGHIGCTGEPAPRAKAAATGKAAGEGKAAAKGRPKAENWPAGAAKEFPQLVLAHVGVVQNRYLTEPFGPLQQIREFADLQKLVMDFGYRWNIPGHRENIAYHVHDAYRAYRTAVHDPEALMPPAEEAMGSPAAVRHLEALTRRMEHLIEETKHKPLPWTTSPTRARTSQKPAVPAAGTARRTPTHPRKPRWSGRSSTASRSRWRGPTS